MAMPYSFVVIRFNPQLECVYLDSTRTLGRASLNADEQANYDTVDSLLPVGTKLNKFHKASKQINVSRNGTRLINSVS